MEKDFTEVMRKKSNSELLEIVTKLKDDYQPEAVSAADNELKNRDLTSTQIEKAETEIEEKTQISIEKENESLSTGQKILFLLFFWGVVPWAMAGTFKAKGLKKNTKMRGNL